LQPSDAPLRSNQCQTDEVAPDKAELPGQALPNKQGCHLDPTSGLGQLLTLSLGHSIDST
jgi:hypothetical protein